MAVFYSLVGWFFNTKIGNFVGFAVIFAAFLGYIYLSGQSKGKSEYAARQAEKALDKLRRMQDANASVSRNRDAVTKRLRDGDF